MKPLKICVPVMYLISCLKEKMVAIAVGLTLLFVGLVIPGCQYVIYVGNSSSGFKSISDYKIGPKQALKLAAPYLQQSYILRSKNRNYKSNRPLVDTIVMSGPWYYVVRDNYPYKAIQAYLRNAVMVHANTGRVIQPKDN